MAISTAVFFFDLFASKDTGRIAAEDKVSEDLMLIQKAKNAELNEAEAYQLFKKATKLEINGQIDKAKEIFELIIINKTSVSEDAKTCLEALKKGKSYKQED